VIATSLSLHDLLYDNKKLEDAFRSLGVTTVEELLFYNDSMILAEPTLGADALSSINKHLQSQGGDLMRLRRNHEAPLQFALAAYESLDRVPIVALNFDPHSHIAPHKKLLFVTVFNDSNGGNLRVRDLQHALRFNIVGKMPALAKEAWDQQCAAWGIND
jgi:hypothetical protein